MRTLTLCIDEANFDAIQNAIAARQLDLSRCADGGGKASDWLASSDGNMAGRYIAEICRHWFVLSNGSREGQAK